MRPEDVSSLVSSTNSSAVLPDLVSDFSFSSSATSFSNNSFSDSSKGSASVAFFVGDIMNLSTSSSYSVFEESDSFTTKLGRLRANDFLQLPGFLDALTVYFEDSALGLHKEGISTAVITRSVTFLRDLRKYTHSEYQMMLVLQHTILKGRW